MNRLTISFIIFAGLLFVGIAIMIKPVAFVSISLQNQPSSGEQVVAERSALRGIIVLGSALTILGLVGLSIQGFWMFKEFGDRKRDPN
jgi:low temperature requirement protein LtrA